MEVDPQDPAAPLTNGVHNHEQSAPPSSRQAANAFTQSENPLERRYRDRGKGKLPFSPRHPYLTCFRPYHCSSRFSYLHDQSEQPF